MTSSMQASNATDGPLGKLSPLVSEYTLEIGKTNLVLALSAVVSLMLMYWGPSGTVKAPFVGYRWSWEPPLLVHVRYAFTASSLIREGYAKLKDSMFYLSRYDGDVLVIPRQHLDDLQNRPQRDLSAISGLIENFGGDYSGITTLRENDLGVRALQTKFTQNLPKLHDEMKEELEHGLLEEIPNCEDWTSVRPMPFLLHTLERMIHRALVGVHVCRDPKWLEAAFGMSHNVAIRQIAMRSLPRFARPFFDFILPWSWKYNSCLRAGKQIVCAEIQRRDQAEKDDVGYVKPCDLLQVVMDMMKKDIGHVDPGLAAEQTLLMIAVAGHSSAGTATQVLSDLVYRPEYQDLLREEASEVLKKEEGRFTRKTLGSLEKLDSFLRESQRNSPIALLGFFRVVTARDGIKLKDGTHVPYNSRLCMPVGPISRDPELIPGADSFDGLRYFHKRRENSKEVNKHQFVTADKTHLHFGYGQWACPGRFLASDILKMLISTLMLRYDIRFPDGKTEAKIMHLHEFPIGDITMSLLFKRRDDALVF